MKWQNWKGVMDVQVEFLISSVEKSLASLENKRVFLEEQKVQYSNIHDKLVTFKSEQESNNHDNDEESEQKGMVMGDVIISSNKCFLNIGYEYYIEKSCDEIIEFINDKLNLMVEALEQFNLKIKEAQETLKNLKQVEEKQKVINETEILKSGTINNDVLPEFDTEFPTMEIREELDEDGNVINSSVRPTRESVDTTNKQSTESIKKIEPLSEDKSNDFESNLKGKLLPHENKKLKENEEGKNIEGYESQHNQIDTENIYSFADLVQQMDDEDEEEDGEFDEDDVEYDYDRFNSHMENLNINDDDEEDEEEYEEDGMFNGHMSMVPGMSGQSSFMEQISKLRAQRTNALVEEKQPQQFEKTPVKPIKKSAEIQIDTKPILKPETDFSEEAELKRQEEKKKDAKKKKKKSVGFAAELDIHEVESFKQETKKQTHRLFPTAQQLMFSNLVGVKDEDMVDDTNNPKLHEFDSDLFASMLGVKGPEEIHDKYSNIVEKEVEEEDIKSQEHVAKKKTRVSRFRKDKLVKKPDHGLKTSNETVMERDSITNEIVERELIEESVISDKIIEHNIIEKIPVVSDIIDKEPVVEDIFEKDVIENESIMNDIIEREIIETPIIHETTSSKSSIFNKKFNSLPKPSSNVPHKPPIITQEMLDSYEPIEDEIVEKEPKIVKLSPEEEDGIFPNEIKEAIHKMGKNESDMHVANVDYSGLNNNLDDMVKAYSLGLYDDDLEEHPGTVLERVEDFKAYNEEVETLSEVIKEFKKKNPMEGEEVEVSENDNNKIMADTILERDIPEDYGETSNEVIDDYGLDNDNLQDSVVSEYYKLKQSILPQLQAEIEEQKQSHTHPHSHSNSNSDSHSHSNEKDGIEPIDSEGNPIKMSKFKSQRLQLNL